MNRHIRSGSENRVWLIDQKTGSTSLRTSASRIRLGNANSQPSIRQYYSGQYFYDKHKSYNKDISKVFNKFNRLNLQPQQHSLQNLTQDHYVTRIIPVSPSQTLFLDQALPVKANSSKMSHRKVNSLLTFTQKQKLKNAGSLQNIKLKERLVLIVLNHNLTKYNFIINIDANQQIIQDIATLIYLFHYKEVHKGKLNYYSIKQVRNCWINQSWDKQREPLTSLFDCQHHKTIIVSPTKQFNGIAEANKVLEYLDQLECVLKDQLIGEQKSESLETFISKKYQRNIQNIADYLQQQDDKVSNFRLNSQEAESLYKRCKLKAQKKLNLDDILQKKFNDIKQTPLTEKYQNQDEYLNDDEQITIEPRQLENEHIIRQYSRELQILQKTIIQNHDPDAVAQMVLLGGKLVKYEDPQYHEQHLDKLQQYIGNKKENQNTYEIQFAKSAQTSKNKYQHIKTKKQILQTLQKRQKLLFTQNIPQLIQETKLNRRELYQTFILYQALEAVSSQMEDAYVIGEGVSFEAFRNGIYQVSMQPTDLAKQMFQQIDYNFSGYLNWREFLNLMVAIRAKTLMDRVNLFIKIADKDGNRALSYDEVHNLTRICLSKYIKDDCQLLDLLCDYFTKLIFETLEVDKNDDIPLEKIKQTILDGGENCQLLSMFCGADL
ncbi:unnamed protein product [Paramecium octaurelia]|uniref:EF-hand domain-containing protein n=1 Tax=Paramecium octaurelia TaxID=43137 RepID=A0A8S1W100_PAROT|nr:unnamed protein product [Paramecium octaurelia]